MSAGYFGEREQLYLDNLFHGLITSSHILHKHNIFDAYGHVSVRNPDNSETFFLPMNMAPALLSRADEILEYNIKDGEPVESTGPHFSERFIHSELYKKFPTVNAIVHSHAPSVLPYTINDVPLRASIHTAGFFGNGPLPVFETQPASGSRNDLLVKTTTQGHALAAAFKPAKSTTFIYSRMRSALPASLASGTPDLSEEPDYCVMLMRGHGFTTCANSLEGVVYQAIYTAIAADVMTTALCTKEAYGEKELIGTVDGGNGSFKNAKVKSAEKSLHLLNSKEVEGTVEFSRDTMMRPWNLWVRETEVDPLYRNEVKKNDTKA